MNKIKIFFICLLLILLNCYYWTISSHKTVLVNFDNNQYKNVGDKTYNLFILKCSINHTLKGKNRDSVRLYLQDKNNWQILGKLNWKYPCDKNSNVCQYGCSDVVDYQKYKMIIQDTSIADIDTIEHVVFENSGLGQIKFNVKKDGETIFIAKKGDCILKTEIISKDGIIKMKYNDPIWRDKIIGPIWF
jgi:hypothetical protein